MVSRAGLKTNNTYRVLIINIKVIATTPRNVRASDQFGDSFKIFKTTFLVKI